LSHGGSDKGVQTIVFPFTARYTHFTNSDTEQAFKSLLKHYLGTNGQKMWILKRNKTAKLKRFVIMRNEAIATNASIIVVFIICSIVYYIQFVLRGVLFY
jgi:hypothetical protein